MARGDVFPVIVVARIDGAIRLVIAGGNHRFKAACALGVKEFDVILVECDYAMFSLLCPALNLYVGQREDRSVRIQQAADAVRRLNITAKAAAEEYKVPVHAVSSAVSDRNVIHQAALSGVSVETLPSAYLRVLSPIIKDRAMLPLAAELCKTKKNSEDVRQILKDVRELPNEKERLDALQAIINDTKRVTVNGRAAKLPARAMLMRSVSTIENIIEDAEGLWTLQITETEAKEMYTKLKKLYTKLAILAVTIKPNEFGSNTRG
jgi:hypothetical protein